MATIDIQHKLQQHLLTIDLFQHEMEVIYLLVELRKLIEREQDTIFDYKSIKFYCDWALHSEKSRQFRGLEHIFTDIHTECSRFFANDSEPPAEGVTKLMYFEVFRDSLRPFFERYELDTGMLDDKKKWVSFVKQLLGVLTDQPIKEPSDNIKEISLTRTDDTTAMICVEFTEPIIDHRGYERRTYTLGNAF